MNHIILLFLALLWAVAADDEAVSLEERRLKNDDYAEGDLCLKSKGVLFHVTGDHKFWRGQKDVSRPGKCKPQKGNVDRRYKTFCGKIGGRTHELRAAAVFANMAEDAGFEEGECLDKGGKEKSVHHNIKMTVGADSSTGTDPDEDCYCEKNSGCLCPCDCNKPGAFEVDRNYVRRIRRRNKPQRIRVRNRRKRNRRKDPFE